MYDISIHLLLGIILTTIISLIQNTKSKIIPDEQNPFLVNRPSVSMKGQTLNFNFKLTSKLYNYNYIAVSFPLTLRFDLAANFTCSMYDPKNKININLIAQNSLYEEEGNIAFCQVNDIKFPLIDSHVTYQFSLKFTDVNLGANYLNKISIFTCSDNYKNRIIFDANYFYGEIAAYNDFTKMLSPPLVMSDAKLSATQLTLFSTFDLTVTFDVKTFISQKSLILFKFPSPHISEPYSCFSDKAAENDALKNSLAGDIVCKLFGDSKDTLVLTGLAEDLPNTRQFKINFRGFSTTSIRNTDTKDNNLFEAMVLYPNSYSVLSYASRAIFNINWVNISQFAVANAENQEIFKGGVWPLRITFTLDSAIPSGAYVVLQQQDQSELAKLNFVASTCDFSQNQINGLISNNFGDRPKCVPLSLDVRNFSLQGNGIFFRVNGLQAKKMYTVLVFAFAESCGNFKFTTATLPNVSNVTFKFTLTIFQDIKPLEFGESRFFSNTSSANALNTNNNPRIFAQSAKTDMANPCFNSVMLNAEIKNQDPEFPYDVTGGAGSALEKLLYNEIHDYKLGLYRNVCDTDTDCYFYNLRVDKPFNEGYLYSKNKKLLLNNSYFAMKALIPYPTVASSKVPYSRSMLAVNVIRPNLSTINKANAFGSTSMHYIFNKNLFQKGDNLCSLWWGYRHEFIDTTTKPFTFTPISTPPSKQVVMGRFEGEGMDSEYKNFITEGSGSPTIDTSFDRFAANEPSIRISTKTYLTDIKVFQNVDETECAKDANSKVTCNLLNFSVFTNCIKWADEIPPPLWQYAYLDISLKFRNMQSNVSSRVNRFFKFITNVNSMDPNFYNSAGEDSSLSIFNSFDTQKIKFYFSNFKGSNFDNAICIISLDKDELLKLSTEDSNMLRIGIFGLTLFDTDYSKLSASYPVSTGNPEYQYAISLNSADFIKDISVKKNSGEAFIDKKNFSATNLWANTYFENLGSAVILNNFTKESLKSNLLVPTFCPNSINFGITIAWQTSYATPFSGQVEKYNSIAYYKETCDGNCERFKSFFANSNSKGQEIEFNKGSIYFRPYTLNSESNFDAYTMHIRNSDDSNLNCKAISILLSSEIKTWEQSNLDQNTKIKLNMGASALNTILIKANYDFYAFGKSFNKAIFVISGSDLMFPTQDDFSVITRDNLGTNFVTGIFRPTLDSFINDETGSTVINGKIAFSCVSDSNSAGHLANVMQIYPTGKTEDNSLPTSTTLELDFVKDHLTEWKNYMCAADTSYPNYINDLGGSIVCTIETPIKLFENSQFLIELNGLNQNSVCSLKSKSLLSNTFNNNPCTPDIQGQQTYSNKIKCPVQYSDTLFDIACYNIITNVFEFPIKTNTVTLLDTDNTVILVNKKANKFSITDKLEDFDVEKTPKLAIPNTPMNFTEISYSYSAQPNAFGKAFFSITFPRKILRNTLLTLYLDQNLSNYFLKSIANKSPECRVANSPANANDNPEAILRTCELDMRPSEALHRSKIIFEFSSENYYQGMDLGSILQFTLFPVFTQFLNSTLENNQINFSFKYQYITTKDEILRTNVNYTSRIIKFDRENYFNEFPAVLQENNLCDITSAFPGIINEYNRITIMLDLQTNFYPVINNNLEKYPLNEVLFWFPSNYIEIHENFECLPKSNLILPKNIKCFIIPDSDLPSYTILKVQFSAEVILPQTLFEFMLTGIKINTPANIGGFRPTGNNLLSNPKPNTFDFLCAFNSFAQQSGKRVTLINGGGKLRYVFTLPNTYGVLNIDSVISSKSMPRQASTLTLRLNFELLNNLTSKPTILDGFPFFVVVFPKEIILKYTKALSVGCALADLNGSDSQQALTVVPTALKACELIANNMIYLQLNSSIKNMTAASNFRYFQLSFNNTYNTAEDTISTGSFQVYLSSETKSYVYQSYQNLNYQANRKLTYASTLSHNYLDSVISYYRGLQFGFDPTLWIIDAYNSENDVVKDPNNFSLRNKIRVKAGRFTPITLRVRPNRLIPNVQTNFTLQQETYFSFYSGDIKPFMTSLNSLEVYFGTSCTTIPGSYATAIYLSNTVNFYPVIPLDVTVDLAYTNNIRMDLPRNAIIKGSVLKIPVYLLEPNFDQLEVKFYPDKKNDPFSKIGSLAFKSFSYSLETSFQSSFSAANGDQVFTVQVLNKCFNVLPEFVKFSIKITTNNSVLDSGFKLENAFVLSDASINKEFSRNSLRIVFTPPVSYGYISCISICFNANYPTDAILMTDNFQDSGLNVRNIIASAYTRTFSNSNLDPQFFSFDNLIRGERYKLKCVFQFTTIQNTLTRFSQIEKLRLSSIANINQNLNNTIYLEPVKNTPTQCIQFYFSNRPSAEAQGAFVDFCQIMFKDAAGCPVCVDSYGNINESVTLSSKRICGNNGEPVMPKKLLNLDIDKGKTPSKTSLYFSREFIGKFSSTKSLANKFIVANNKRIPLFIPDTAPYLLCVVQDKGCATNMESNVLNDYMNKLHLSLNTEEKIRQNIAIPRLGYLNSFIISDTKPQIGDIADFIITTPDLDSSGNVFLQIYYKIPLLCHWKIQLLSEPIPEAYAIEKCFDDILCGSGKINMIPKSLVLTKSTNVDMKKTYKLFIICYNDLPYPVNSSEVVMLTLIEKLDDIVKYDDSVPNQTNNTNSNSTISGSAVIPSSNTTSTNSTNGNKTRMNY